MKGRVDSQFPLDSLPSVFSCLSMDSRFFIVIINEREDILIGFNRKKTIFYQDINNST